MSADRDTLARIRTELANERTLLAWLRTALGAAVAAIALIRLWPDLTGLLAAITLLVIALVTGTVGLMRYQKVRGEIA